jgi:hypothetical protein
MKYLHSLLVFTALALSLQAQTPLPGLRGTVTDPSGALVPGAVVQLRGPGGEQRQSTNDTGQFAFPSVPSGKYQVRVIAKGFSVLQKSNLEITGPLLLDAQLTIEGEAQVVNVEDEISKVSADPAANGGAIVMQEKQLEALSDDPDELASQLQAMAGPGAGPNGGQIYIDGFTGSNLPPKASIREVRINSNPFSPEYDRPGFGRIEIFTKPGADSFHGSAMFNYNKEALNSRSPLLTQAQRPPYQSKMYAFSFTGPIKKNKASFGFDGHGRRTTENAFILATDLDSNFNPRNVNQAILTPQNFMILAPRVDYAINSNNSLTVRFMNVRNNADKQGVGNFSLASRAYDSHSSENSLQVTETAVVSPRFINETRFQYARSASQMMNGSNDPAIVVQGAFTGGGAQVGNSGNTVNRLEFSNTSTFTRGTHTVKWGGRGRQGFTDSVSMNNFGGSYTFLGGTGPQLDALNQPIAGTSGALSALEVYRRTLLFQSAGMTDAQIRALGGGAYQFSLSAGLADATINQFDIGLFINDDWRLRPNLTLSYGLRYETQSNISDFGNWSPRVGIAWGIGGKANRAAKTVLRAGFGSFFDRINENTLLNALRFNGVNQQSYMIFSPSFFPSIPTPTTLAGSQQPQQLQFVDSRIQAPRNYQANVGVDRQITAFFRLSANYITGRGVHLQRSRDINAPIAGLYPFGDTQLRLLTETTGFSRTNQFMVNPSINYKKLMLFGFYAYSHGRSDAEGQAADPYNLRAEWGPSSFADIRHRMVVGTTLPLAWKFTISPFIMLSSGAPYNITSGLDANHDGFSSERPALVDLAASGCTGQSYKYAPGFGCFSLNPAAGTPTIERNSGRGPANANVMLRLSRSWVFGGKSEPRAAGPGGPGGPGGPMMMGGGPPPGGGGGHGPGGPMMMGGPGMMGGAGSGRHYTLTLGINAQNAINHANYAAPSGDLSSPYFGVYRSLAGGMGPMGGGSGGTYNRKIDVQLRFAF